MTFPPDFLWGAATSAFQIEGSLDADGRGESIWDRFAGESGDTGAVACDHYRRWRGDLDLLPELGLNAYRLSLAWPRIFPDGRRLERRGLDHYDRVLDRLLELGVEPVVTLYHWDLPATLDWRDAATVERFAEYAAACFDAYGDRVRWWVTINEPWIVGVLGYQLGLHAPGLRDLRASVHVMHHLLRAHAEAADALGARGHAGIAYSLFPHDPESAADEEAARLSDGYVNRWFLDPVLRGAYPDDVRALYEERVGPLELEGETAGGDFVGVNYYTRRVIRSAPGRTPFPWEVVVPEGAETTDGGWEVHPQGLAELLLRLRADYGDVPVLVTENGGIFDEPLHDQRRIGFLRAHVDAIAAARDSGVDVRGYFHWSLLDNFEWALGYAPRFGLVHVDYETQARTIKDSGGAYRRLVEAAR
ncbi:MAG TPA: GH1 family beta-glucosidase [Gaiellaceae bacterium]|nr:GH1 family beta-glucosidase [Gaiellaceae bacterium]